MPGCSGTLSTSSGSSSFLDLSIPASIALALFIATIKVALVASIFMHLIDEKTLIYWILGVTVAFLALATGIVVMFHFYGDGLLG